MMSCTHACMQGMQLRVYMTFLWIRSGDHGLLMSTPTPCNLVLLTRGQRDAYACVETVTDFFVSVLIIVQRLSLFIIIIIIDFVTKRGLLILKMIIQELTVDTIFHFDY